MCNATWLCDDKLPSHGALTLEWLGTDKEVARWSRRMTPRAMPANWASNEGRLSKSGAGTRTPTTTSAPTVEDACGGELLDEDTDEVVDVVLLWWRDGDGDLVDTLMDAISAAGRRRRDLGAHAQDRQARPRAARRDRGVGAYRRADADLVGQPRRLERQPVGAAEVAGRAPLMLPVGATAPDFTLRDQNRQPVTLSDFRGAKERAAGVLPAGLHRHLPRRARSAARPSARLRERRQRGAGHFGGAAAHPQGVGRSRAGSCSRCSRTSGRTARSARPTACSTTTPASPTAARSSSTGPGTIRFAEMKQPGEARDQRLWTDALAALKA